MGFNGSYLYFGRDVYGMDSNYQGKTDVGANDGQWHFVAFTCDGATNRFYFDGNEVSLTWQDDHQPEGIWFASQDTNTNSIGICNRPDHWGQFTGGIDEVRIYNRALSPAEITNLNSVLLESTMRGGIGIHIKVKNEGTANAMNVTWHLTVTGGPLHRVRLNETGVFPSIAPGEQLTMKSAMFLGFGHITIKVQVGDEVIVANGKKLLIFTIIYK